MLNVIMLNVIMLNVIMLNVIMLYVIMLSDNHTQCCSTITDTRKNIIDQKIIKLLVKPLGLSMCCFMVTKNSIERD
jgi:hypothetical protein